MIKISNIWLYLSFMISSYSTYFYQDIGNVLNNFTVLHSWVFFRELELSFVPNFLSNFDVKLKLLYLLSFLSWSFKYFGQNKGLDTKIDTYTVRSLLRAIWRVKSNEISWVGAYDLELLFGDLAGPCSGPSLRD